MTSFVQLLEHRYNEKLNSTGKEYIAFVVEGAKRMYKLVNDLLAYSRVDSASVRLTTISLESALQKALHGLTLSIAENNATVTWDELPSVNADRSQLTQVFQNLIGNAIKFRGEADPAIHITATRSGGEWLLSLRDNGIGFPQQYAEQIFQLFQRLYHGDAYAGTGIGLTICKRIIERHGGRIWAESQPGKGATFYFTLPATDNE